MLQNNNREIVRKIAFRSMKQNRIRNGIVILAVILTTFMFTTIFTIGASLAEGMVVMLTRQQGTRSSIYLDHPMAAQVQQIEENRYLYAAGCRYRQGRLILPAKRIRQFCSAITTLQNLKRTTPPP